MIYSDYFGKETMEYDMRNSFNLTKDNVKVIAKLIVEEVSKDAWFMNIQIPSESSQYDVVICFDYNNQGYHQRGIKYGNIIIGVIGFGLHGFDYSKYTDTSIDYYKEKLGVHSELLTELFNEVRGWYE